MDNKETVKATVYNNGNPWQKKVYKSMAKFLESKYKIKEFGKSSKGKSYKHLLSIEQARYNFITENIFEVTKSRFEKHKAGDKNRIMTNTAASQPYCFNLVIFLNQNKELANNLFSDLMGKKINIIHIEPEFTPNLCNDIKGFKATTDESIGDQNLKLGIGTDSDIALFYEYENNKKGILLVEYKFIEAEFSICTSFKKKKRIREICNSENFFKEMVVDKSNLCGYNKYYNWNLTMKSTVINGERIKYINACPFRFGLNQLWRNMLLAERVSLSRNCNEFGFWIFSPFENYKYLWKNGKIENEFREILTAKGNNCFKSIYLELIFEKLKKYVTSEDEKIWLKRMGEKYIIE